MSEEGLQERVDELVETYNKALPSPSIHLRFFERGTEGGDKALFYQLEMPDVEESMAVIGHAIEDAKRRVENCRKLLAECATAGTPDMLERLVPVLRILEVRVERALLCRQEWVGANGGAKYE